MNIEETISNLRSKKAWLDSYGVKYKWVSLKSEDLHWLMADWEAMHSRFDRAWGITDMSKKATHDNQGTDQAVEDDA